LVSPAPAPAARPLWLAFLSFLGPLVLTNVLQALSGTLNNIYVGQLLGVKAVASVSGFFPLLMFFVSFAIGLGVGASILTGQAFGAGNNEKVRAIAGTALWTSLLLGVAVGLCGIVLAEPIMKALGTPADVLPESVAFARVMMGLLPLMFVQMTTSSLLRGLGDSVTPLYALIVSTSVTFALTPALILGWGGLPRLGVTGGAWATLAATACSLAWVAWHLRRRGHVLAPGAALKPYLKFDGALMRPMVKLGIPTGLFFITGSSADLALVSVVNSYGSHATAAWGAVAQVMAYIQFPAISIAIAGSILAAQAIGAGRVEQIAAITRMGLFMNIALTGGLAVLVTVFARPIVGLIITDPRVVDLAAAALHVSVWGSVIFGLASVFSSIMRAAGTVLVPTIISLGCLAALIVPLGLLFSRHFGLPALWATYPATYFCALVMQAMYFHLVWRKKPIRRMV
jgi:putative MATE family efflux protein